MSAVAGLLSISNSNNSDLVGEYQETILVRNAKGYNVGTTLFGLMSRLKTEETQNTEYNWFERNPTNRIVYSDGATASASITQDASATLAFQAGTSTVGTDGADAVPYLVAGTVLRNDRSGEYLIIVTTPTNDGSVAVKRAINGTATYSIVDEDAWAIVTLGKDEGADPVRSSYEEPEILTNYAQTFNSTVEITNAFKANKLRSDIEGPLRDRRIQALERISKDIEFAYLLGVKRKLTGTNGYQYLTGGIKASVDAGAPSNALNGQGNSGVSLATFKTWLQSFMVVGSDAKLAFCGPKAYAAVSNFANSASNGFRIMNQETVFGMNITVIVTPFGELSLAFHPLLKEVSLYNDWAFVVDLAHLVQKTQEPLFLEPNIQTPGQDTYKEQYRAKLGLKLKFAEAFGYAYDLSLINAS